MNNSQELYFPKNTVKDIRAAILAEIPHRDSS
jgi:hypothetical protein